MSSQQPEDQTFKAFNGWTEAETQRVMQWYRDIGQAEDQTTILIAVAYIELLLQQILRARFIQNWDRVERMFNANGPCSTLSQMTLVAEATGAISSWLASEIDRLRKIRNSAAHTHERVSLDSGSIGDQVDTLRSAHELPEGYPPVDRRDRFIWAASNVAGTLQVRLRDLLPLKRPLPHAADWQIMTQEEREKLLSRLHNGRVILDGSVYDFAPQLARKKKDSGSE